jgi:hypothetical protein
MKGRLRAKSLTVHACAASSVDGQSLRGRCRGGEGVVLNMTTQAETTVNMFHSLDGDMAPQSDERFRGAETLSRNQNLALQALASFESLLRDAIESSLLRFFVTLSTDGPFCRNRRTGQCNGTRLRLRRSPVEAMTRRWPSQSRKGRNGSFLRTVEQCSYAISQRIRLERSLKKGALAGHSEFPGHSC